MKKNLFVLLAGAVFLAACATAPKTEAQLNDDYTGTFFGVLPCADCGGIETELTLQPGGAYSLDEVYEKNTGETFASSGKWTAAKDLKYVELTNGAKPAPKTFYAFDGKDALKKLDANAQPIRSNLNYTLTRKTFDFNLIKGRVWKLAEAASPGKTIFDAAKQDPQFFSDIYTIQFDGERASGKAAPNRYNAPYVLGKVNAMTFKPAAATMMMGIREPEGLREYQFFQLLAKVYAWNYVNGKLVLYTVNDSGDNISMKFEEFDYRK